MSESSNPAMAPRAPSRRRVGWAPLVLWLLGVIAVGASLWWWQSNRANLLPSSTVANATQAANANGVGGTDETSTTQFTAEPTTTPTTESIDQAAASGAVPRLDITQARELEEIKALVTAQSSTPWSQAQNLAKAADLRIDAFIDLTGALVLANRLDQTLSLLGDVANPARAVLAEELRRLQADPRLDRAGWLLKLQSIETSVMEMPLRTAKFQAAAPVSAPLNSTAWESVANAFSSMVRIRDNGSGDERLLLNSESHAQVRFLVQLRVAEMRWALLNNDGELFASALKATREHLARYFDASATNATLSALDELAKLNVGAPLPSLRGTQQAIAQAANVQFAAPALTEPTVQ